MSDEIRNSILNKSSSKQRYTFSKTKRFKEINKSNSINYYDLPDVFSKKIGKTFSKSQRKEKSCNITSKSEFYNVPREFDDKRLNAPAYTFGISRKYYDKVYIEKSKVYEKNNPGPGSYDYLKDFGSNAPKFTKYLQVSTSPKKKTIEKLLGPGEYMLKKIDINKEGRYTLSTFRNTYSLDFGNISKSKSKYSNKSPQLGPGKYEIKSLFDGKGFIFNSKFRSSLGKSFGKKFKDTLTDKAVTKLGPGQYSVFSEFGCAK